MIEMGGFSNGRRNETETKKTGGQGLLMMTTSGANASEFF
jgi:hypothetical protein